MKSSTRIASVLRRARAGLLGLVAAASLAALIAPSAQAYTERRVCDSVQQWPNESCWGYSGSYHSWLAVETEVGATGNISVTCATAFGQGGTEKASANGYYCNGSATYRWTTLASSTPISRSRGYYQGLGAPLAVATRGTTP